MGYHEQWHVFDITPYCHTSKSNMLSLLPMDHKNFCKIQALHNRITCPPPPPPPFWYSLAFKNVFESWSSPIAMVHNKIYSNILLHLYIRLGIDQHASTASFEVDFWCFSSHNEKAIRTLNCMDLRWHILRFPSDTKVSFYINIVTCAGSPPYAAT